MSRMGSRMGMGSNEGMQGGRPSSMRPAPNIDMSPAALIPDSNIWKTSGMIIPAIMTLICFICTAVSLTVSGFICLRDREAQDETDNKAKHHKQQEFISKVLGLFYKVRTSNIFRIQEIMQDLNDERPVWIGSKSDILMNMDYYGINLSEVEKVKLAPSGEVYEIDCETLFYFELERFSKAQAVYGGTVTKYFECVQQDGSSFPREFYPDSKDIYHIDIISNVFTEMQTLTELFVLLSTGIDLEIINIYSIPPQFIHSKLGDELSKIKDFLYNYYKRVFPNERSYANVMRKLPQLPIVYEPIFELVQEPVAPADTVRREVQKKASVVTMDSTEESERPSDELSPEMSPLPSRTLESPVREIELASPVREVAYDIEFPGVPELPTASEYPVPQEYYDADVMATPQISDPYGRTKSGYFQSKGKRIMAQVSKRRMKIVSVYKTLAQRLRLRSRTAGEQVMEESAASYMGMEEMFPREPDPMHPGPSGMMGQRRGSPVSMMRQEIAEESNAPVPSPKTSTPKNEPSPKTTDTRKKKRGEKSGVKSKSRERLREKEKKAAAAPPPEPPPRKNPVISEKVRREQILDAMRRRYKAPHRADSNPRRRGRLARVMKLDHNAFTYMVTRVLAFLQDRGRISEEELHSERFRCIDRNFIV